jgi:hypothetical protein
MMKKALSFWHAIIPVALSSVVCVVVVACTGSTTDKSKKDGMGLRYPVKLIEDNLRESDTALHVAVNKVTIDETKSLHTDRGKIGYAALVFHCNVIASYKGDLKREENISFLAFWEFHERLLEEQQRENRARIVFLNKSKKGSYHALSHGVFFFSEDLDRSLKKLSKTQN